MNEVHRSGGSEIVQGISELIALCLYCSLYISKLYSTQHGLDSRQRTRSTEEKTLTYTNIVTPLERIARRCRAMTCSPVIGKKAVNVFREILDYGLIYRNFRVLLFSYNAGAMG